jgi:hypothetical protein
MITTMNTKVNRKDDENDIALLMPHKEDARIFITPKASKRLKVFGLLCDPRAKF